jgi:cell division protease FtsH
MDVRTLGRARVLAGTADVSRIRERNRRRRLLRLAVLLGLTAGYLWARLLLGSPVALGWPEFPGWLAEYLPGIALVVILALVLLVPMAGAGRSPHVLYRPSELTVSFDDIAGLGPILDEVVKSLNLFLGFKTFRDRMGGTPRRALLFEGPPGTGKTYMAKAMAREAGVPFLFVSSSAFQSMYYGQTNRKIRSYFKALRTAARNEGGAIGFIEEIDAIAMARRGMRMSEAAAIERSGPVSEGISGIVNELLIQMQSFDQPTRGQRFVGFLVDRLNRWLPEHRQVAKPRPAPANVLLIAATNRAGDLDPALLRPGRFDRSIHFGLPGRSGRREIIDYYLARKAHEAVLDEEDRRDTLAAMTSGYSPVMIEHLFDEALVWALRSGRAAMSWDDVLQARMTEEIGLAQPVEYTEAEKRTIATHEAGHAVVAWLEGTGRKLDVLSIVKRKDALGLLAHSDSEERFTQTRSELEARILIAMGGMVAEELFFGESGTGPAGDLAMATQVAARMVGSLGMAGSLVSLDAVEVSPVGTGVVGRVLADADCRKAVECVLDEAKARVEELLDRNRHLVEALRDALLEREELVGDEILAVLDAAHRSVQAAPADLDIRD